MDNSPHSTTAPALEHANDQQTQDISPRSVHDIDAELDCVLQMVSFDGP